MNIATVLTRPALPMKHTVEAVQAGVTPTWQASKQMDRARRIIWLLCHNWGLDVTGPDILAALEKEISR